MVREISFSPVGLNSTRIDITLLDAARSEQIIIKPNGIEFNIINTIKRVQYNIVCVRADYY